MFAQHFSCGSSVTGEDEIGIQGDVGEDIVDFITEKWPEVGDIILYTGFITHLLFAIQVEEDLIELVGDQKG